MSSIYDRYVILEDPVSCLWVVFRINGERVADNLPTFEDAFSIMVKKDTL